MEVNSLPTFKKKQPNRDQAIPLLTSETSLHQAPNNDIDQV